MPEVPAEQGEGQLASCPACAAPLPPDVKFCVECGARLKDAPTLPPRDPTLPDNLGGGRYVVTELLHEGRQSRVYLAHDTRLDRDVELIELRRRDALDPAQEQRLQQVIELGAQVAQHPHIVTIFDLLNEDAGLFIVGQHIAGGTDLGQTLAAADERRLEMPDALRIAAEIAQGLEQVHVSGGAHGNVRPSSVRLDAHGYARLTDFALTATFNRERFRQGRLRMATATYLAPELATGGTMDARSDLYALGCVLYEMVTGGPPFVGDDALAVINQHLHASPVDPAWRNPDMPAALDALILELLAKAPADRPADAGTVGARLQAIIAEPQSPPAETPTVPTGSEFHHVWGRFVGREEELARAHARLDAALDGVGSVVMLAGEPGIGKTRMAEELVTSARLRGAFVLTASCFEGDEARAYWLWIQLVRRYLDIVDPAVVEANIGAYVPALAPVMPDIVRVVPDLPELPPVDPEYARTRVFDTIINLLADASRRQPVLLVVDGLQWADRTSLLLLQHLANHLTDMALLVLGTYRPEAAGAAHPLTPVLGDLRRMAQYEEIQLAGLSAADVSTMLTTVAGQDLGAEVREVAAAVHRVTEGNPFFTQELVLHLLETGAVYQDDSGRWVAGSLNALAIPESVRQTVEQRLTLVSEPCLDVLRPAAVIGRHFDAAVVQVVTTVTPEELPGLLEEAEDRGLIAADVQVPGRYEFTHGLIRDTLYADILGVRRVHMHLAVGYALEQVYGETLEPHFPELAHHFTAGAQTDADIDTAVAYAVQAAEHAMAQTAYDEAALGYEHAIQALERRTRIDNTRHAELLLRLGRAWSVAGKLDGANSALTQCMDRARAASTPVVFADATLLFARHHWEYGVADDQVLRFIREARALLPTNDSAQHVSLQVVEYTLVNTVQDEAIAETLLEDAWAMACRLGDSAAQAEVSRERFKRLALPFEERLAHAERVLRFGRETNQPAWEGSGLYFCAHMALEQGDPETAEVLVQELDELAQERHLTFDAWSVSICRCTLAEIAGRLDEAEQLAAAAHAAGMLTRPAWAMQRFVLGLWAIHWLRGTLGDMLDMFEATAAQYDAVPGVQILHAFVQLEAGHADGARTKLERYVVDSFPEVPLNNPDNIALRVLLAELAFVFKDRSRASKMYDPLLPYERQVALFGTGCVSFGPVAHALGQLATTLERWEDAERHFGDALDLSRRMESPVFLARAQAAYGNMLLARDTPGDREHATQLADEALATACDLGLQPTVDLARDIKARV